MTNKTDNHLTEETLVRLEPELGELLAEVRAISPEFRARRENGELRFYGYRSGAVYSNSIKPTVEYLVGPDRRRGPSILRTQDAFDLALRILYEALPNDFDDDEIADARERACDAGLDEGEEIVLIGPGRPE